MLGCARTMPFLAGIGELTVAATERSFRWQEYSQLHGLFNCCRYPDEPLQIVFRPLRIMVIASWVLGLGDDVKTEQRYRIMVSFQQISIGKRRCLKIPVSLAF